MAFPRPPTTVRTRTNMFRTFFTHPAGPWPSVDGPRTIHADSGMDDMDLRVSDDDPAESNGEEDAHEILAEKQLRLAKVYLQSVKEGLMLGDSMPEN